MRLHALLPFTCALALSLPAAPRHAILLREATAAAQAGDNATAIARLEEAAALRPDYPRILLNLARLYAAQQRPDDALAALRRLADMGLQLDLADDPRLAPLHDLPPFASLATRLRDGPTPMAPNDEAAFALADVSGIIESCLIDPGTLRWYFSDVRNRCIWRRDVGASGAGLVRFTHEDDAWDGIFRIALSPDRRTLWASTAAAGAMAGTPAADGERSALAAIDFATGRVRARFPVPDDGRKHLVGDFIVAPDGSLFATDSLSPVIWRLPAGGDALEPWLESGEFLSLQGIALAPDGQTLFVADYGNGIWAIDVSARRPRLLRPPADTTLFGIDGIAAIPGGLVAVQNGVSPQRVIRISPVGSPLGTTSTSPASLPPALEEPRAAVRVLALGHPQMTDLALGQFFNGRFHFVANSGWALFDPPAALPPASRAVTVLSVPVD